jgi:ABC-type Fe3+ transport system permease subunit
MQQEISEQSKQYRKRLKFILLSVPILYVLALLSLSEGFIILALIMLIIVIFGHFGAWIADVAESKGRSWKAFFWLSILISPLITGLIVSSIRGEDSFTKTQAPSTLAGELSKLKSLHESGAISDEEYNVAKDKTLGN